MAIWPFRRRSREGSTPTAASSAPSTPSSASSPAAAGPLPAAAARSTGPERAFAPEWQSVANLRPTVQRMPLVAPLGRIADGLSARHQPEMMLAPLGHQRHADGPIGVVGGLLTPLSARPSIGSSTSSAPLDVARAPRPPDAVEAPVGSLRWPESAVAVEASTPSSPSAAAGTSGASAAVASGGRARASGWAPVSPLTGAAQRLAVSTPLAPTSGSGDATASTSTLPPPAVLRVARPLPAASAASFDAPSSSALPLPFAHPQPSVASAASGSAPAAAGAAVADQPVGVVAPLTGARTVVRRRIGEPLAERPASMVPEAPLPVAAQRLPSPSGSSSDLLVAAAPMAARPFVARADALPVPNAHATPVVDVVASAMNDGLAQPISTSGRDTRPLVGSRSLASAGVVRGESAGSSAPGSAVGAAGSSAAGPFAVRSAGAGAAQRLPAAVPVRYQRASDGAPERVPDTLREELEPVLGADLSNVPVHRGESTEQAAVALQAKAFTTDGEVHLPSKVGPLTSGEGRSVLAHELTHVAQQRRLGTTPDETTPAGVQMEDEARQVGEAFRGSSAGSRASAGQRLALPVPVRPVVGAAGRAQQQGAALAHRAEARESPLAIAEQVRLAAEESGVAQRLPDGTMSFPAMAAGRPSIPTAQRLDEGHGSGAPAAPAAPPGGQAMGSMASFDPSAMTTANLEALAGRLYDRLRSRLRSELLADRERSGTLHDRR